MWFRQIAGVDEKLAKDARLALNIENIGLYLFYGILVFGAFLIILGALLQLCHFWGKNKNEHLIQKPTEKPVLL